MHNARVPDATSATDRATMLAHTHAHARAHTHRKQTDGNTTKRKKPRVHGAPAEVLQDDGALSMADGRGSVPRGEKARTQVLQ